MKSSAKKVAFLGLMFAMSVTLSFLESLIPVSGLLPPGVKLGLSNIITMYTLFFLSAKYAYSIAVLKSLFVLITRGVTAGFLSALGGLLSVTVMLIVMLVFKKSTYLTTSIIGAVAHNIGQLIGSLILLGPAVLYYSPILLVSGVVMGVVTGLVLKVVMPALEKLKIRVEK